MDDVKGVIADPDARTREFIAAALRILGVSCRGFATAREALEACRQERPDLLLVEAELPDASGFSLVRRVRENAPDAEVCLMSTTTSYDNAVQGIRLGVSDYLLKPLSEPQLDRAVRRSLERTRTRRSSAAGVGGTTSLAGVSQSASIDPASTAAAVLRVLQGQAIDHVAQESGATPSEIEAWSSAFRDLPEKLASSASADSRFSNLLRLEGSIDELTREVRETNALIRDLLRSRGG